MLGEYAQDMSDAPYILENMIENWEEEHSAEVFRHQFLLFFLASWHLAIFVFSVYIFFPPLSTAKICVMIFVKGE